MEKVQAKNKKNTKLKKQRSCIACDSIDFVNYTDELVECTVCGLIVARNIPSFKELSRLYKEEYFFGMEYSDYINDRPALEKNFKIRLKHLSQYLRDESKVLEIGCAYGYFLNMIKDKVSWSKGYDVSEEGITYAKNQLKVNASHEDFLSDKEIKPDSIDLICMWDVIEHLGEPEKHVEKISKVLKKGGAISLTTGDIGSFVARRRGSRWRMIHPPTHVYYFSEKSIEKLLSRYGLQVVSIRHRFTYRNVGSVFNQLIANKIALKKDPKIYRNSYKIAKIFHLDKVNFPLNLLDVMEVTAIKK